jgi:hypothetical protein
MGSLSNSQLLAPIPLFGDGMKPVGERDVGTSGSMSGMGNGALPNGPRYCAILDSTKLGGHLAVTDALRT